MSRFTLTVELLKFPKGNVTECIFEDYSNWQEADQAYEAWHALVKKENSKVIHVWLKENREVITHKESRKGNNVGNNTEGHTTLIGDTNVRSLQRSGTR